MIFVAENFVMPADGERSGPFTLEQFNILAHYP
jgi:hypothetical protein